MLNLDKEKEIKSTELKEKYKNNLEGNFYKSWIETYASDEYVAFKNEWLDELLSIDNRKLTTGFYLNENKDYEK